MDTYTLYPLLTKTCKDMYPYSKKGDSKNFAQKKWIPSVSIVLKRIQMDFFCLKADTNG